MSPALARQVTAAAAALATTRRAAVVVNANRAGGAWTALPMLLESLALGGVPADHVLVVCRGGGRADVPTGVKAVEAEDRGDVTGLVHVAENPNDIPSQWVVYLQDTMVVGQNFAGLVADACAEAARGPAASPPLCVALDNGVGLYDAPWLSSLPTHAQRSVQDVLAACPAECRRRLDPEVRDVGTFRHPRDAEPPRRIDWYPALDVYEFVRGNA